MAFEIEKNVEIPPRGTRVSQYPIQKMAIGDSFFVPDPLPKGLRPNLYTAAKGFGLTLATRKVEGGMRVWRVASKGEQK